MLKMPIQNIDNQESDLARIDYNKLENFLAQKNWREADAETMAIMLTATNRQDRGYIGAKDARLLPIAVLQKLNSLWDRYSNGQFGFTVQKRIWHQAQRNYSEFGDLIGWRTDGQWLNYGDISFDESATTGHLPALMFPLPMPGGGEVSSFVVGKWRVELLSRHDIRQG
ncbi:GUN4 domain protein [Thalassoporum mexicanum PCC 7367]|uniref:GUN4 domain-containing protein n=1 Tax=Thalassoporum mexicanum TaxID=3457544 RepID=UPI00029F91A7|nr:GUN4 domain-containing protein [Pseudanabaena sp. PCC 7367]AFY70646.1 GUN4 domain protein [Pseudanabaena sp. PCC 7367]